MDAQMAAAAITTQPVMTAGMKAFMGNNERDWSTGLCSCCSDCKQSMLLCVCPCVFQCFLARRVKENWVVPWCVPGGMVALRTRIRSKLDIKGSICNDCMATMICGPCVACQMWRELDHIGIPAFKLGDA